MRKAIVKNEVVKVTEPVVTEPVVTEPVVTEPVVTESFFSEQELEKAIAIKTLAIAQKEASAQAKAAKTNDSFKIIHANSFKGNSLTATGLIELALCIAARACNRVSPDQIEKFVAAKFSRNAVTHKGDKSTSDRAFAHVRDCSKKYNSLYFSLDDKGMIVFLPAMKTLVADSAFNEKIDSFVKKHLS